MLNPWNGIADRTTVLLHVRILIRSSEKSMSAPRDGAISHSHRPHRYPLLLLNQVSVGSIGHGCLCPLRLRCEWFAGRDCGWRGSKCSFLPTRWENGAPSEPSIPLSAAVGRRFSWRCLTRCNILSLNIPIVDELLVICLTDLFT